MTREVVLAIRELMQQEDIEENTRDLAAFISLTLEKIHKTIDVTVAAWEKRDYWVKADRFRLDWAWSGTYAQEMQEAVIKDDWESVAIISAKVAQKLNKVHVPKRHRLGEPWHGAFDELKLEAINDHSSIP
jgi:hypothetical protein